MKYGYCLRLIVERSGLLAKLAIRRNLLNAH
jgi:hypothetical protein